MNGEDERSPSYWRVDQIRGRKVAVRLCQDPFLPVAGAFRPLPESHDVDRLTPSPLFIWAHYPDSSVTGFVTLSSPIRRAAFSAALPINFHPAQLRHTFPPTEE